MRRVRVGAVTVHLVVRGQATRTAGFGEEARRVLGDTFARLPDDALAVLARRAMFMCVALPGSAIACPDPREIVHFYYGAGGAAVGASASPSVCSAPAGCGRRFGGDSWTVLMIVAGVEWMLFYPLR